MNEGDTLYIPKGYVHEAKTSDSISLHLTIGVLSYTWYDVLVNTLTLSLNENRLLRKSLPPAFAMKSKPSSQIGKNCENILNTIDKVFNTEKILNTIEDLADKFIYLENGIGYRKNIVENINIDSKVKIRPEILFKKILEENSIKLIYSGNILTLPLKVNEMLDYIMNEKEFKVKTIKTKLNDESKIIFIKHLISNDFLVYAD